MIEKSSIHPASPPVSKIKAVSNASEMEALQVFIKRIIAMTKTIFAFFLIEVIILFILSFYVPDVCICPLKSSSSAVDHSATAIVMKIPSRYAQRRFVEFIIFTPLHKVLL